MAVRKLLEEILRLQPEWQSTRSVAMDRRGVLVRRELPGWLRHRLPALAGAIGESIQDLAVEGRDGTGPKSELPWARLHSRSRSPSATVGWYVVYLFDAQGRAAYASLNQGTTVWDGVDYVPRDTSVLEERVAWARKLLASPLSDEPRLLESIELFARRTKLGRCYEAGNVVALKYPIDAIPGTDVLEKDLLLLVSLLGDVYRAAQAEPVPGEVAPEVADVLEATEEAAGKRRTGKGQGFRLSAAEKDLVEHHAMERAKHHFVTEGWTVKDVSRNDGSYDLHLTKGEELRHVEVKGTTTAGETVVLTRGEVQRQREYCPNNGLVVVRHIQLDRSCSPPRVSGGELVEVSPWTIADADLKVVSYLYDTNLS